MDYYSSPSPFGGTKEGEYHRSAELFADICKNQHPYFAIAFLADSQYDRKDLIEIMKYLKPTKSK